MHTYKYLLRYENSYRWTLNCLEIQNLSVALLCHQPVRGGPGVCSMRLRHSEKNVLVPVPTVSGGGAEKDHLPSVRQVLPLGLSWIETGGCYPSCQQLRTGLFVGSFERQVWKKERGQQQKELVFQATSTGLGGTPRVTLFRMNGTRILIQIHFCHQVFSTC